MLKTILKLHALLAAIGISALAVGTVFVLTAIPIITMNHLMGLWLLAMATGFNLWRFTKIDNKYNPPANNITQQ